MLSNSSKSVAIAMAIKQTWTGNNNFANPL